MEDEMNSCYICVLVLKRKELWKVEKNESDFVLLLPFDLFCCLFHLALKTNSPRTIHTLTSWR